MLPQVVRVALALFVGFVTTPSPVPARDEKAQAQERAVKELVGKVVTAIGKKDIDAIVEVSDYPWIEDSQNASRNEKSLRHVLKAGLQEKPVYDAKYVIKSIQTFKEAEKDLLESEVKWYKDVLGVEGFILAHVEIDNSKQKLHARLLIKMRDGKPRLVGLVDETRE